LIDQTLQNIKVIKQCNTVVQPKTKNVIDFQTTLNEKDKKENANFIDYQGVLIIPTIHMIDVAETNILKNVPDKNITTDSNYYEDMLSTPRPPKSSLDHTVAKESWSREKSIFKNYKLDTTNIIKECFETDWENSNITRIIKDEFDRKKVKEFLRSIYLMMKETYRNYSGTSFVNLVP